MELQKNFIGRVLKAVWLLACVGLFLYLAVLCILKLASHPEHSEVKYMSSKDNDFPSFTLCPSQNCNTFEDLQVKKIEVRTYAENGAYIFQSRNLTLLSWELIIVEEKKKCYTFSLPKNVIQDGISWVGIEAKSIKTIHMHKIGTLTAPVPVSILSGKFAQLYQTSVTHETIKLLSYEGRACNGSLNYNYDQCKLKFILQVC